MHSQFRGRDAVCDQEAQQKREYSRFHRITDQDLAAPAQGDVRGLDEDKDVVADLELHFFDRADGDDRDDFTNACLNDDFTENFVGDDALNSAGKKLIVDALFFTFKADQNGSLTVRMTFRW
jgi:hypothetical protein